MKKKILSILMIGIVSLSLIGCGGDVVGKKDSVDGNNNRFVNTGDNYDMGQTFHIYYDTKTKIVYFVAYANGGGISPMLNENKQPMTIDEYNKTK